MLLKQYKKSIQVFLLASSVALLGLTGCSALDKVPGMDKLTGGSGSTDTSGVLSQSKKMVKNFIVTLVAINYAQSEALEAFGLGDEAEKAKAAAKAFESGVSDEDQKNKIIAETKARDKIIADKIAKNEKLTGEARTHFAKSAASYAGASYAGGLLAKNAVKFGETTKDTATKLQSNPISLAKFTRDVAPGAFVVSQMPSLSAQWADTTKNLIAYAKANGDDVTVDKNMINME